MKSILLVLAAIMVFATWAWHLEENGMKPETTSDQWAVHKWSELSERREASGKPYLQFIDRSTLSSGLYALPKGATDGQQPHDEDELYYVVKGQATFRSGEETTEVGPGDVIFVKAEADHKFEEITEDLEILVFFSKAPVSD